MLDAASKKSSSKRSQEAVPYTTDLQRRKRRELLALRQEAKRLNALLVPLLQRRQDNWSNALDVAGEASNWWRSLASIECEERHRAEKTNQELKGILADQEKVGAAFRKLLEKQNPFEGREFVLQLEPAVDRSPCRLDYSKALLGELTSGLEALRLDTGMIFSAEDDNNCSIITRSQDKRHAITGRRIAETYTVTPLACPMQNAVELLWSFVTNDGGTSLFSIRKTNPHSREMNCVVAYRENSQIVNGVVIYRRYNESDRVVMVGSSTWFLPTGGVQFEDKSWTVVSPSPSDPQHACVVRTRYELQAKATDTSVFPTDLTQVKDAIMSGIGEKLRNAMQAMQNALISVIEFGLCP
ncbi:hypothetical protein P3T76_000638 [Phytophthora citrophthora]|uniref:START domain-containing protein n=1 Tax=Phytophthora citrophthora TaxID=4793 RepID=A0AAD9H265_9STRA|nr:hypothetical protein P3T76_000638 [Phytophthora citrophthora]